jgi:hypothetical protein
VLPVLLKDAATIEPGMHDVCAACADDTRGPLANLSVRTASALLNSTLT